MKKSTIGDIELDVLLTEKVVESVTTTDHPVEEGVDPTDHARVLPLKLTLEALFSNIPMSEDAIHNGDEAPRNATTGVAQQKYDALLKLKVGRALTVETPARKYVNMQIVEISRNRDSKLGTDAIQFTIQLKEIVFVSTQMVRLEISKKNTAVPKKPTSTEEQSKKTPAEQHAEQRKSLASRLLGYGAIAPP